jgi:hypothetical protein
MLSMRSIPRLAGMAVDASGCLRAPDQLMNLLDARSEGGEGSSHYVV